ncbi:ABC transporter permease (plasmid) [Pseudorhodobacter turbinis]|uniref:ABC transporter permease n=1 Tax=Pseudorhodobacter turbinis TaxID=2500533 RepID=A0A4P8EJW8_9RHOB|nr:ABC transporter permease [Pseudorhodobacter turbinis]QCO57279.1 ABC transporter permease [Pseudorhodobacter turbinis]
MLIYTLRRVLAIIPVMVVVALVVFSLLYFSPGDPALVMAGETATPEEIARIRTALGLDRPYLVRLAEWSFGILRGDFGQSIFFGKSVAELIVQRTMPTLWLSLLTMFFALALSLPLGIVAAWQAGRAPDRIAMGFAVLGYSMPVFVLGYLLIFAFSVWLGWFPVQGYKPPSEGLWPFLSHLILPAFTLGVVYAALIARITRSAMLEVLRQDYMRTARAKGLSLWSMLLGHALKNAAIPIMTIVGIGFGSVISGVVVTETVFNIPGIGRLTVDAILRRDYPVIQGVVLALSGVYVLINLLVDLSYGLFDPRMKY